MKTRKNVNTRGFTLVEVMFASFVSTLVVLGIVAVFVTHANAYHDQKLLREMQQNARFALDAIARDLRMAGYGLNVHDAELKDWIPWGPTLTDNPMITPGASETDPDTLTMAGAFDPAPATLRAASTNGATVLQLVSGGGAHFNTGNKSVIFVGRRETARVVSIAGDSLTISTDPLTTGHGLRFAHTVGAPVDLVQVITYSCEQGSGFLSSMPYLVRQDHADASARAWYDMLAAYIEDLQVSATDYAMTVAVTARTSKDMADYVDDAHGDAYRRITAATRTIPRNAVVLGLRN